MALEEVNMMLNINKCELSKSTLRFFGHIFSSESLQPYPMKVQTLIMTPPASVSAVRSFLGMVSYFIRYIKDFASVSTPLRLLLGKGEEFHWSRECEVAFNEIKECISSAECMAYYGPDL
ncbi:uncharacterized protein [Ambystoma mexicanum]|uniref:uncharacterized protein n=1 Tax=Ambystoma mexicanum TaxID=8296 RepID=UPI0037E78A48